jgi:hypothetical protein
MTLSRLKRRSEYLIGPARLRPADWDGRSDNRRRVGPRKVSHDLIPTQVKSPIARMERRNWDLLR